MYSLLDCRIPEECLTAERRLFRRTEARATFPQFNINPITKATVRSRGRVSEVAGGGGGEPES